MVNLATVRERVRHRRWPTEIIEKFLAAEIITQGLASRPSAGAARRFNLLRVPVESYAAILSTLRR